MEYSHYNSKNTRRKYGGFKMNGLVKCEFCPREIDRGCSRCEFCQTAFVNGRKKGYLKGYDDACKDD